MANRSRQKLKYLENEKSFQDEIKSIFHHFGGLSLKQIIFLEGQSPTSKRQMCIHKMKECKKCYQKKK